MARGHEVAEHPLCRGWWISLSLIPAKARFAPLYLLRCVGVLCAQFEHDSD